MSLKNRFINSHHINNNLICSKRKVPVQRTSIGGRLPGYYFSFSLILIFILACFTIYFCSHLIPNRSTGNVVDLSYGWELVTESDSQKVTVSNIKSLGDNKPNQIISISKVLEEADNLDTLLIKGSHQYINVYLGDVKLFETSGVITDNDPGIGLYFIRLPDGYEQKTLRLQMMSLYERYSQTLAPVYIGTASSLTAFVLSKSLPVLFYFFTCLLTGFSLIVFSIYSYYRGVNQSDKLCLGLFSVFWGFYCVIWDNIACLFFTPAAVAWISAIIHIIYLIPFYIYFRLSFTICRKFTLVLFIFFCCTACIMCLLLFLSVIDIPDAILIYNYILDSIFLPIIVIGWFEFKRGNPLVRFLSPTILLIIVGVIGTILDQFNIMEGIFFYLASIFIFICVNWIYHIREILNQRLKEKKEFRTLEIKNSLMINRYDEMQSHMEKIREIRHEIKHHIAALQILCSEREIDRIDDYLSNVSTNQFFRQDICYSKHPIVDCILSNYTAQAKEQNLKFKYQVNIPPLLKIPDPDLCSLLLNMLDNAIEASSQSSQKWIWFDILLKDNFLIISCQNSHCGLVREQDGKILTQKREKEIHGHGLPIMKAIVEKYQSTLVITYDSEQFKLKTVLQL